MARKRSDSGYYHVVPKGESNRLIFESDYDKEHYLEILQEVLQKTGIKVHAYVLMSNHIHLVLSSINRYWEPIAETMRLTNGPYAMYFKEKYERVGKIFRTPLWSEPIEDDNYLAHAVRYVHANPAVAGICKASVYPWSSVRAYLGESSFVETEPVLSMLGGRRGFINFSRDGMKQAVPFPGSRCDIHLTDEEALTIAKNVVGKMVNSAASYSKEERCEAIRLLADTGLKSPTIARVLGISKAQVTKVLRESSVA